VRLQHVRAMARKEWRHLMRDPRSLALILLMPTMLLFLFGYAIRLDVSEAPIGVLQQSPDAVSEALTARFDASNAFHVAGRFGDIRTLRDALAAGDVWAGLVIPRTFAGDLENGDARVQLLLDGVDANTARLLRNYATLMVTAFAAERGRGAPFVVQDRAWFNQGRESRIGIVPGVIAIVMAVIGALMTSLTIAREMESGNLVMLRTAPLTRAEFLAGKLVPYFLIGMADLAVATAAASWIFGVPLRGPVTGLIVVSALFLLVVMLQGALISINTGNQLLASQVSLISTFLPAFLLSGFIYAIDNMPTALQYITLIVPARYFVALSRVIFLKGLSPLVLWTEVAALTVMLLLLMRVTLVRSRKLGLLP